MLRKLLEFLALIESDKEPVILVAPNACETLDARVLIRTLTGQKLR